MKARQKRPNFVVLNMHEQPADATVSQMRLLRDASIKEERKADYPHAMQAMVKLLDRAEDLIQS
jgi:hypothetical protein